MRNAEAIAARSRPADGAELHIASFIVQHRPDAIDCLVAGIAGLPGLERVDGDDTRSIVLCESFDPRALMDGIEKLRAMAGVINVSLVYHHAEPGAGLDAPVSPMPAGGTAP